MQLHLLLFILKAFLFVSVQKVFTKMQFFSFIPHWLRDWNAFDVILYSPLDARRSYLFSGFMQFPYPRLRRDLDAFDR